MMLAMQVSWALQTSRKKVFSYQSNSIPDVKFLDNLIGWTLTNAGERTLELKLSQL